MNRSISITQPTYLPWTGYFDLIFKSEYFVFLDDVQLEKQSWQTRNRLRSASGDIIWLSIPVQKAPLSTIIKDIQIAPNPSGWRSKHQKSVYSCLSRAQYFSEIQELIDQVFSLSYTSLSEHNIAIIKLISSYLGIEKNFCLASSLGIVGDREDRLLSICKYFGATTYYSNKGSSTYLQSFESSFRSNGISLIFQEWPHPIYGQGKLPFFSHLSILDALAHMGKSQLLSYYNEH